MTSLRINNKTRIRLTKQDFIEVGANSQGYKEYQHKQTGMVFVFVPAGKFQMGSNEAYSEKPIHEVVLNSFLISKYEVTQGIYQKVMGLNPSGFKKGDNYPVEYVSWGDCDKFCKKTGLRLPTEAEWEYACRAGTSTKYYWGDKENDNYMWFSEDWKIGHHPVGEKKPNGFGLCDMNGNVWEWCQDWYDDGYYKNSPQDNPKGPLGGQYRVLRGGSWGDNASGCRSCVRGWIEPAFCYYHIGFRCALTL
ncbi:MAG: formylglycine-generating enzyme family protein [Planctomycetota bacterium]